MILLFVTQQILVYLNLILINTLDKVSGTQYFLYSPIILIQKKNL